MQPHFGLLVTTLFLVIVGIILIYSTSAIYAQERFGDSYYFFKRHLVYSSVALTLLFTCLWIPLDFFKKISFPFLIFSMLLLILVFIPGIGQSVGIASRWLKIGAFRFQPAEIAKLALVFYLSYIITEKDWSQKIFQKLMPHFIIIGIILGCLALQPDFGSVVIFCGLIFLLVFVGGIKFVYVLTSFIAAAPFIYFLALGKAYRRKRLLAFLNPWNDPQNSGYQIIQSYLAFFSGGFLGRGLGEGRSKLFYLPEAHTDFIYASLAEELGFIGALTVL
ncbi:MAG TPA: putative peptidoglycan glycosyltransferase FtsW, partial [Bdellovibrionota bacterium]|nr:putative peptidoglycan glycosyltransferase FtsW [Bdellovibrionota bacterium]